MQWEIDFYIFDGSLLHHPINDMMRNYHISSEQAAAHVEILQNTLKDISWKLFYLYSDNPELQLLQAYEDRKQGKPTQKQIKFWKERFEKDKYVLENGISKYEMFNISNNRQECVRENILQSSLCY